MPKSKKVYVGIRIGGIQNNSDIVVATALKGLCDESGISYGTMKTKDFVEGKVAVKALNGDFWMIYEKDVIAIEGRGNKSGVGQAGDRGKEPAGGSGPRPNNVDTLHDDMYL